MKATLCINGGNGIDIKSEARLLQRPGEGAYGIILMHSVHSQTVKPLPRLIDYIRDKGFQIWSLEDVVKARHGKTSAQLLGKSERPITD